MEIKHRSQLVDLLRHLKLPLHGIELGVAEANFSRDLLESGMELLYSVDAWQTLDQRGDGGFPQDFHDKNYKSAIEKLSKYGEKSVVIKGLTSEVAPHLKDNFFGVVYIDCDHSYNGVKRDIETYYSKLVTGGVMGFHDFFDCEAYGVIRAVYEFAMNNHLEVHIIEENKEEDRGAYFIKK